MKLLLLSLTLVLCVALVEPWGANFCTRTRTRTVYVWRCKYRTWRGCCAWGWFCITETYTEYFCCRGWRHNGNQVCNIPICSMGCDNGGYCEAPDRCYCPPPYQGTGCRQIKPCSSLKPCYPGYCDATGQCICTNGYRQPNCTGLPDIPETRPKIDQSTVVYAFLKRSAQNMSMYEYTVDASMSSGTEVIWTNRREFNYLNYTFRALYKSDYDTLISKPSYISQYKIGIISGRIFAYQTKLGQSTPAFSKVYDCTGASISNPVTNEQFTCEDEEPNYNIRIDNGDEFEITFTAVTGGRRWYTLSGFDDFIGYNTSKKLHFKFDLPQLGVGGLPYHCSVKASCTGSNEYPLHISNDVTKTGFTITWGGWKDDLSGVSRYAWEIYKLVPKSNGDLQEPPQRTIGNDEPPGRIPEPLIIRALNHSDNMQFPSYTPQEAGVYSVILEVGDKANNTVYARRIVIYDPVSDVTINESFPLYVASANQGGGYKWQNSFGDQNTGNTLIIVKWNNHFQNRLHEQNHFLEKVDPFSHRLDDMSIGRADYKKVNQTMDDSDGLRTTQKINNFHGIVKFEVASSNADDNLPSGWTAIPLAETYNISKSSVTNGGMVKVWVRATDILNNTRVNYTRVYFDNTKPGFGGNQPDVLMNIGNDPTDFRSRIRLFGIDTESAVTSVRYKFKARSSGNLIHQGMYQNPARSQIHCQTNVCDKSQASGKYYERNIDIDVSNCDLMVPDDDLDTEVLSVTLELINDAELTETNTISLSNLTNLRGVKQYYGPTNIQLEMRGDGSARVTWEFAPSCYPRYGFMLFISKSVNSTLDVDVHSYNTIHKDARSQDITGLEANVPYKVSIITKYGTSPSNLVMSGRSYYTGTYVMPPAPQTESNVAGPVAGSVVALIIIGILVFGFIMWKTGRLARFRRGRRDPFHNIENPDKVAFRVENQYKKEYRTRAVSDNFEDDIYVYGEKETNRKWVIDRKSISFIEEIARGRFAIIYKAKYFSESVVAKTLKEKPTDEDHLLMRAKGNFYSELSHPNLLKFIGIVEDDHIGPFLVMEYCEIGAMNTYLVKNKDKVDEDMHERLFTFSFDICKGMNYLASQGHVHRRLAARNVLLTFTLHAKLTGFGPTHADSRDDDEDKKERVPIKWMAPECISSTKHANERSDVWSFGVVLWEIFSMGDTPYPGIRSHDVAGRLKRGERMKKPEHADSTFYRIMKQCWEYDETKRPTFEEILDKIEGMFKTTSGDEYYYDKGCIYDNNAFNNAN